MNLEDLKNGVKDIFVEFKEPKTFILAGRAICGDSSAQMQLVSEIAKNVLSLPDMLFFHKFKEFLDGTYKSEDDRSKMREWIVSNGDKEDNAIRIMSYIDNAISLKKIKYFSNATRCALNYEIDLETYFEICHAIDAVLESDLKFLSDNIIENYEKPFNQNYHTQKLYSAGLMTFIQGISTHGRHRFNVLAKLVDVCAVNFDNDARYPNRKKEIDEIKSELSL